MNVPRVEVTVVWPHGEAVEYLATYPRIGECLLGPDARLYEVKAVTHVPAPNVAYRVTVELPDSRKPSYEMGVFTGGYAVHARYVGKGETVCGKVIHRVHWRARYTSVRCSACRKALGLPRLNRDGTIADDQSNDEAEMLVKVNGDSHTHLSTNGGTRTVCDIRAAGLAEPTTYTCPDCQHITQRR